MNEEKSSPLGNITILAGLAVNTSPAPDYMFGNMKLRWVDSPLLLENWGSSWDNDIASLRVFMATFRKKIEKDPNSPQYIQTHIGVGYRMLKVD